jgi:hypothetical protein
LVGWLFVCLFSTANAYCVIYEISPTPPPSIPGHSSHPMLAPTTVSHSSSPSPKLLATTTRLEHLDPELQAIIENEIMALKTHQNEFRERVLKEEVVKRLAKFKNSLETLKNELNEQRDVRDLAGFLRESNQVCAQFVAGCVEPIHPPPIYIFVAHPD